MCAALISIQNKTKYTDRIKRLSDKLEVELYWFLISLKNGD